MGASSSLLVAWNDNFFQGQKVFEFTLVHSRETSFSKNIYGPSLEEEKLDILDWLNNIQTPSDVNWLILGDFNEERE